MRIDLFVNYRTKGGKERKGKGREREYLLIPRVYIPVCEDHLCLWIRIDQFPGEYRSWEISHGLYRIAYIVPFIH